MSEVLSGELKKGELLYEGKAKRAYLIVDHPDWLWLEYKDSLTAFNAQKKGEFAGKGAINKQVSSLVFRYLEKHRVSTHWVQDIDEGNLICQRLEMIPLEVVVRNRLAGSTAKKFNRPEGEALERPLVEFYYKDDALQDPFISDEQALMLGTVNKQGQLNRIKLEALKINECLIKFFSESQIELIDFKLEFGWNMGAAAKGMAEDSEALAPLVLGDEISPDSCRLWDQQTGERMDKDRFRRDLGAVEENYREVLKRVQERWEKEL